MPNPREQKSVDIEKKSTETPAHVDLSQTQKVEDKENMIIPADNSVVKDALASGA